MNTRSLPRVTRKRDGLKFDRAPGTYWMGMAAAVYEGRKPVGRKPWECVIVHPRRQQGSRSNVSVQVREALEDDSDNDWENPHHSRSLLKLNVH